MHHSQIYQRYKQLHSLWRPALKVFSEEFLASERRVVSTDFPHSKRCEYTAHLNAAFVQYLWQFAAVLARVMYNVARGNQSFHRDDESLAQEA